MFKLKKEADLKRNYFITSSRLKLLHLIIIVFSIFILLSLIVSIRAPAFIQILCIVFTILSNFSRIQGLGNRMVCCITGKQYAKID